MTHKEVINRLLGLIDYSTDSAKDSYEPDIWLDDIPALRFAIDRVQEDMPRECENCSKDSCEGCPRRY